MAMEIFIAKLFKVAEDSTEIGIGLRMVAVKRLVQLFPRIFAIRGRYLTRDMLIPYRYEIDNDLFVTIGKLYCFFIYLKNIIVYLYCLFKCLFKKNDLF